MFNRFGFSSFPYDPTDLSTSSQDRDNRSSDGPLAGLQGPYGQDPVFQTQHEMNMIGMPGYAYDNRPHASFIGHDMPMHGYNISPYSRVPDQFQQVDQELYRQQFHPASMPAQVHPQGWTYEPDQFARIDRQNAQHLPPYTVMDPIDDPNVSPPMSFSKKERPGQSGRSKVTKDQEPAMPASSRQRRLRPKSPIIDKDELNKLYPSWYRQITRNPVPCPSNFDSRTRQAPKFGPTEQCLALFDQQLTRLRVQISARMLHDYLRWHWDWQITCIQRKDYFRVGHVSCQFFRRDALISPQEMFIGAPDQSVMARVLTLKVAVCAKRWDDETVQLWQQPNVRKLALGWVPNRVEIWPNMQSESSSSRAKDGPQEIGFHHLQFAGEKKESPAKVRFHKHIGRRYRLMVQLFAELEDQSEHLVAHTMADPVQLHGRNPGYFLVNEGGTFPREGKDDPAPEGKQRKKRKARGSWEATLPKRSREDRQTPEKRSTLSVEEPGYMNTSLSKDQAQSASQAGQPSGLERSDQSSLEDVDPRPFSGIGIDWGNIHLADRFQSRSNLTAHRHRLNTSGSDFSGFGPDLFPFDTETGMNVTRPGQGFIPFNEMTSGRLPVLSNALDSRSSDQRLAQGSSALSSDPDSNDRARMTAGPEEHGRLPSDPSLWPLDEHDWSSLHGGHTTDDLLLLPNVGSSSAAQSGEELSKELQHEDFWPWAP